MGYRSEVRCLIYGNEEKMRTFITMKTLIENSILVSGEFKDNISTYFITINEEKHIVLDLNSNGTNWKWYESYSDVQLWNQFMKEAEEFGLTFEFLRIGEGDGFEIDVEHKSNNEDQLLLYISTPTIEEDFTKESDVKII